MKILKTHMFPIITAIACVVYVILRFPSLFEPHWYADEGIYAAVAYAMKHGRTLYTQVWDNKPPLIYFFYMLGGNLFGIKLLSFIAGLLGVIGIGDLTKRAKLMPSGQFFALLSSAILLGSPLLEGNIANAENFFVPLVVWGLYFGLSNRSRDIIFSGFLFGISFLLKFHPLLDFAALICMTALVRHSVRTFFEKLYTFGIGFLIPIIAFILFTGAQGTFMKAMQIIFFGNVSYTQYYQSVLLSQPVRIGSLACGILILTVLYLRKKLSAMTAFLGILLLCEYFGALLSGRRYVHYLLQTIPAVSLLIGYSMEHIIHHTQTWRNIGLFICVLMSLVIGVVLFNSGEGTNGNIPPGEYYTSYIRYVAGRDAFFLRNTEDSVVSLKDTFGLKPHAKKVIYTNNPWYYVEAKIVPPITTVSAYHQYLRPFGTSLFAGELGLYNPDIIAVDKESEVSPEIQTVLSTRYQLNHEDAWFSYFERL